MGSFLTGIGLAAGATALDTLLIKQGRSIQTPSTTVPNPSGGQPTTIPGTTIIPDCVIEERHKDDMEITQVPVEQGAPISDHAFKKPAEVVMRVAWSTSKSLSNVVTSAFGGNSGPSITDVYQQLQNLQIATSTPPYLQPFTVVTGKRTYKNMLLRSLQVVTNKESENSLMVEAIFQQVLIVSTKVQSGSSLLGATQNQSQPQNTAPPVNTGTQQLGQTNTTAANIIAPLPTPPAPPTGLQ